jgi:hypothetical protein
LASPVFAEPATQQGAEHLTQVFQTYFGPGADVVRVLVNVDVYDLIVDVQPLIAQGVDGGLSGSVSPLSMQLVDNGDGTWGVSLDQSIMIDLSLPNAFDIKEDIASLSFTGTFDETLMAFSKTQSAFSGLSLVETLYTPDAPPQKIEMALTEGALESTSRAAAAGGTDFDATFTATGLTETMTTPAMNGEPAMPITIKAESLSQTVTGSQFMGAQILQLVAWVNAHPDQAAMEADQAGLKALLSAAMPFFGNMQATGTVDMLSIDTPMGAMGIEKLGFAVDVNGAVADGKFREGLSISGLTLPAGLVPDWAAPLVPQAMSLDVQITDFDPAAAITAALSALDLPAGTATGPEFDAKLQAALLPNGTVTITLNPGSLTGADYALTYEGDMVVGPDTELPTGKATVTLTGADALTAALNAAPDDMKAQAMMGFGMAQGMAKAEGDKLIWEIDAATPGALSVNGMALMGGN